MPFFPKDFGFTAAKVRRRQGHAVVVITGGKTAVGGHGYAAGTGNDHRRRCHAEKAVSPFDFPPPFQGAVTAEYNGLAFCFQGIQYLRERCDIDVFLGQKIRPVPTVDAGVDIALLGIDESTYPIGRADKIIGQANRCRHADDGHIPGKGKAFGRRQPDAKACKGPGTDGNGNAVDL